MPAEVDLDAAVEAGIITPEQAARMAALPARREPRLYAMLPAEADVDQEMFRFVRGFQDVFLTIGIVVLLVGTTVAAGLAVGPIGAAFASAVIAFALSWYFARRKMLVLPSIALATAFTLLVGSGASGALGSRGSGALFFWLPGPSGGALPMLGGSVAAFAAATLFFSLFRLPFSLGLIAATLLSAVSGLLLWLGSSGQAAIFNYTLLGFGLAIFAAAMAFDLSDPDRQTPHSDNAFWLHLVAAPTIVHSLIGLLIQGGRTRFSVEESIAVIAILLVLGLVALVIDRRALLVAGLGYLGIAVGRLLAAARIEASITLAATLVLVGAAVVLIGVAWRWARGALLGTLPATITYRLPPVSPRVESV